MTLLIPILVFTLFVLILVLRCISKNVSAKIERQDLIALGLVSRFITSEIRAFVLVSRPSDLKSDKASYRRTYGAAFGS